VQECREISPVLFSSRQTCLKVGTGDLMKQELQKLIGLQATVGILLTDMVSQIA